MSNLLRQDATQQPELDVADTVGRLMEFWGFKRPMGRIWTLLYLSPDPLGAAEIGAMLKMSSGGVSMALTELLQWGAIRKTWRPGERRDFYEAETSIGKLVQRVLRERELTLVREFAEALGRAEAGLSGVRKSDTRLLAFKRQRLQQLRELSELGETLLDALVSGQAIDPAPLLNREKAN